MYSAFKRGQPAVTKTSDAPTLLPAERIGVPPVEALTPPAEAAPATAISEPEKQTTLEPYVQKTVEMQPMQESLRMAGFLIENRDGVVQIGPLPEGEADNYEKVHVPIFLRLPARSDAGYLLIVVNRVLPPAVESVTTTLKVEDANTPPEANTTTVEEMEAGNVETP